MTVKTIKNSMLKRSNFTLNFMLKLLFIPIFFELVIGGSGHYSELGPLTLRMFLYFIAVCLSLIFYFFGKSIKKNVVIIITSFTICCLLSIFIGFLNHAPISAILEDFKPLSFFYILPFFSLAIKSIDDINKINKIIKVGSVILALVYLLVILLLVTGKLDFLSFYGKQSEIGEVMFRNETLFFYKGFLYLCVGFFFFLLSKGKFNFLVLLLLFSSIVLTLTRGFILFTLIILIYYVFFISKNILLKWAVSLIGLFAIIILVPILFETLGDKSDSDTARYVQIEQVISAIDPISFLIGHGFGVGVPIRKVHMELSFLEIFHKQGLIGISFWAGLFIHIFIMYFNIKYKKYKELALPFLLSVVFIILQSMTNPYVNNPIGLTMILITIVVFSKLLDFQKNFKL